MTSFVDREDKLADLQREYESEKASFVVIYGRRRIGKTSLINEFCRDKNALFFLATEEGEQENRNFFRMCIADFLEDELLRNAAVDHWEILFRRLSDYSVGQKEKFILILDEFQYLGAANPAFPSILMRIWDQDWKEKNIMLILCGSLIHMMTTQVLSYDSPLYGRRTAQMRLGQIPFSYYGEFMPGCSEDERIQRYAVTGGVPKYIELFRDDRDIYEAIRKNVLSGNSFLYAEPEFLLQKEVSEVGSYFSILKTIAAGNHKLGKIASVMGVVQSRLTNYLRTLSELDLVERQVPVTEENPEKSKKGLYFIRDNFIEFWFKFVYPYRGMLETGHDEAVMEKIRNNFIDNHVAYVYENICREKCWNLVGEKLFFTRVGRWWGSRDVEIDIVAYDSTGRDMLFGECKYTTKPKGMEGLWDLKEKARAVTWKNQERREYYAIFSRSGFTKELEEYAKSEENIFLLR